MRVTINYSIDTEEIPDEKSEIGKQDLRINPSELEDIKQLI